MSSPVIAPSAKPALCRAQSIEYKAYARRFRHDAASSVLCLFATCSYNTGGFSILFQPAATGFELIEEPPAGLFHNLVSYCVASWTSGVEAEGVPSHVTITDAWGDHAVAVRPW